jgi:OOP family OmpA-OmpF porin
LLCKRAAFGVGCSFAASCTHTLAFSDSTPIAVIGRPPPPPAPPPPKPPPPPPPAAPKRVEVQADQIVIRDKIQFDSDRATIKPESFGLMDEIVAVVQSNAQLKRLSIEGHTDSTGSDKHNLWLSAQRAGSVLQYLVQHGVAADRLVSKGWGEKNPIAENATPTGREQNRRVEFVIVEQDVVRHTYEVDPKTGARREVGQTPVPAGTTP